MDLVYNGWRRMSTFSQTNVQISSLVIVHYLFVSAVQTFIKSYTVLSLSIDSPSVASIPNRYIQQIAFSEEPFTEWALYGVKWFRSTSDQ